MITKRLALVCVVIFLITLAVTDGIDIVAAILCDEGFWNIVGYVIYACCGLGIVYLGYKDVNEDRVVLCIFALLGLMFVDALWTETVTCENQSIRTFYDGEVHSEVTCSNLDTFIVNEVNLDGKYEYGLTGDFYGYSTAPDGVLELTNENIEKIMKEKDD